MASYTLYLRGDQIGSYSSLYGEGNGVDRVVTLNDVHALGSPSDIYRVEVHQVADGASEFQNGQFITIYAPDGNVIVNRAGARPDEEQGLAAGDEHLIISDGQYLIDLGGVPSSSKSVSYSHKDETADASSGDNDGQLDFREFPCISVGTRVSTLSGPKPIENLEPGDLVFSEDGGLRSVLWNSSRRIALESTPKKGMPVLFRANCFGPDRPRRDVIVSPQHRIGLSALYPSSSDYADLLVPARGLVELPGVRQMLGKREVTYVSLLLDRHSVILAEGLAVESFYPGPEGLRMLGTELTAQVCQVIPGLREMGAEAAYGPPARRVARMKESLAIARSLKKQPRGHDDLAGMAALR